MQTIDELNGVYSFKDAVKVVENILHETKQERDSYGPVEGTGLYNNWDAYYRIQERVEVIEDILTALHTESSIMHHIDSIEERETRISTADQFTDFPIGQKFYPPMGEAGSRYLFVKTGHASAVRIDREKKDTVEYYDENFFDEGNYSHWEDDTQ